MSRTDPAATRTGIRDHLINVAPAVPGVALALVAIPLHYTADFGLAYRGGVEAWNTGHPQHVVTFSATPLMALIMALVSRTAPEFVAARVFTALNIGVWMVLLALVWPRLRSVLPPRLWWTTLAAAALFAPAVSTIFWLQFNVIVLVLALGGFLLIGKRDGWAGFLIGLSIAIKPIVILLPLALLVRPRLRAAGIAAIACAAGLTALGFVFLAWRAGDAGALNPVTYFEGFVNKGESSIVGCSVENYAPAATLCRVGIYAYTPITIITAFVLLALIWVTVRGLPDTSVGRWEVFAAGCFLSMMFGPIDWAHYGVLMGPLYLLLVYQMWRERAPAFLWIGIGLSFALTELVWDPLSSLAGASIPLEIFLYTAGQFGQYFLLAVWLRWRILRAAAAPAPAYVETGTTNTMSVTLR